MPAQTRVAPPSQRRLSTLSIALLIIALSVGAVGVVSRLALLTVLIDGSAALLIVAPAALGGLWLVPRSRWLPRRWHLLYGAALGLGAFSLLVLAGGWFGLLHRTLWIVVLAAAAVAGVIRMRSLRQCNGAEGNPTAPQCSPTRSRWSFLWMAAAPFLTLALLSASNAPGFIWQEEGYGYDVLEYHLQLPQEYLEDGRITYLPHNVYANFPANVEMLYLLAMIVHGDPLETGTTANMIHLLFAVLTVGAAWAIGRDRSPVAGVVGGVVAATAGWLEYLSGLAYVENAMLFFGLCAAAAMLRAFGASPSQDDKSTFPPPDPVTKFRWVALSGGLAGLACGCKYTSAAMIALPLLCAIVWLPFPATKRIRAAFVFALAALISFSPWLVKNLATTGSPVFPLANEWFRAAPPGWSDTQTQQWERGHTLRPEERTPVSRLQTAWARTAGDSQQRLGPHLLMLGTVGLLFRRRTVVDAALVSVLVVQFVVWMLATHLYARFAVPLLIPLVILATRSLPECAGGLRLALVATAVTLGAAWNFAFAAARHGRESADGASASLFYEGQVPGFEFLGVVNRDLPADSKVLLVGEARAFYFGRDIDYFVTFNRNPFLERIHAQDDGAAILDWIQGEGYTYVLVNWSELRRLSHTYGLAPPTTVAEIEQAIARLCDVGLKRIQAFSHPNRDASGPYVELFAVPSRPAPPGSP